MKKLILILLLIAGSAFAQEDAGYKKAVIRATQIVKTQIIPRYTTEDGFNVKPMDIHYDCDPTIAKFLDEFGSIWKQLSPVVASEYTVIQQKVNERTRPDANKYRDSLINVFNQAIDLRGGGSASSMLFWFAPAQQEWIIAHLATGEARYISDQEFVSRLQYALTIGGPSRDGIEDVLNALKTVEKLLAKNEATFLRAQFLFYFENYSQ